MEIKLDLNETDIKLAVQEYVQRCGYSIQSLNNDIFISAANSKVGIVCKAKHDSNNLPFNKSPESDKSRALKEAAHKSSLVLVEHLINKHRSIFRDIDISLEDKAIILYYLNLSIEGVLGVSYDIKTKF